MDNTDIKIKWYNRADVLTSLSKFTKFKEVAFLEKIDERTTEAVRYKCAWTPDYMSKLISEFCKTEGTNIYISAGNMMIGFTKENYRQKLTGYDFIIDFDTLDRKKLSLAKPIKDTIKIARELRKFRVPFSIVFSGRKGFQLRVLSKSIPDSFDVSRRDELFHILAKNLKEKLNLKTLDDGQYIVTQLIKLPLSYCNGYICFPISFEQLQAFDKEDYKADKLNLKYKINYFFEENPTASNMEAKSNFKSFYDFYAK